MSYIHITEQERYVISHLNVAGFSKREIARPINRHHSTVSRELKRNGPRNMIAPIYWYYWTHSVALRRRHQARHYRRGSNRRLVRYVKAKLNIQWSPEKISNHIRIDYPDDEAMRDQKHYRTESVLTMPSG